MEQKEKQVLASLIATILIIFFYSLYVYNRYIEDDPEILNNFRFWGKTFLVLIPVSIIVQIVIHILFAIVNKIITDEDPADKEDERDRLIELKSVRVSHWTFTTGFMLAMGSLALGLQPWVMFVILIASGFISEVVSGSVKIYYYRKGV
jgi:hypothetical protein